MIFDEHCYAILIDPFVRVDAGTLHHAIVCRNPPRRIDERHHMERFRGTGTKIEKPLAVLDICNWVRFKRMDHVRELNRIANEKNLQVITDEIPVTVFRIKLYCKSPG